MLSPYTFGQAEKKGNSKPVQRSIYFSFLQIQSHSPRFWLNSKARRGTIKAWTNDTKRCMCACVCVFRLPEESRLLPHFTPDELPGRSSRVTARVPCHRSILKLRKESTAKLRSDNLAMNHLWKLALLSPNCEQSVQEPHRRSLSIGGQEQVPSTSCLRGCLDISPPFKHLLSFPRSPRQDRALHTQTLGTRVRSQFCPY